MSEKQASTKAQPEALGRFIRVLPTHHGKERSQWRWNVKHSKDGDYLGSIRWDVPWKCFVLVPLVGVVFSSDCLTDIAAFLKEKTEEAKKK